MTTIEIDFDVYKALTLRRSAESVAYNDVLRELLALPPANNACPDPAASVPGPGDWVAKGVRFPRGTEFRAQHKGQTHYGKAEAGMLVLDDGERFEAPSAAAIHITGTSVNGWTFWECRMPGENSWHALKSLRRSRDR
jgi:hypothetical protein